LSIDLFFLVCWIAFLALDFDALEFDLLCVVFRRINCRLYLVLCLVGIFLECCFGHFCLILLGWWNFLNLMPRVIVGCYLLLDLVCIFLELEFLGVFELCIRFLVGML
jgi:hypothetical protein